MTTEAAARQYAAEHVAAMDGKTTAFYNPSNKPVEELPVIYGFCAGGNPGWYQAQLLSQDGHGLGSHICSHECYMEHDLGILEGTRPDRHEYFKTIYPDGYRMKFIPGENAWSIHPGLKKALELNQAMGGEEG